MSNRRLIRTSIADATNRTRESGTTRGGLGTGRKNTPPEQTNAETFYYLKQMASKTPMVLVMTDGEILHGTIEWYDRDCLKLNRERGPNLLLMKPAIKYMYKEDEERGSDRRRRRETQKEQSGEKRKAHAKAKDKDDAEAEDADD